MTTGQLPQRAGLPGLNGGGAAAVVPPRTAERKLLIMMIYYYIIGQGSFTGEEEEEETHDERVSKVEERAGESCNLELSDAVSYTHLTLPTILRV